jgi:hypothetical protein
MLNRIHKILTKKLVQYKLLALGRGHVLVLVGQTATYVGVYKNQRCIDSLLIQGIEYNIKDYHTFFSKFKKYHVSLIIDTLDVIMQSADIPTTQGILKDSPVKSFILQNFTKDDIVAHNVYDITTDSTEIWHTIFARLSPTPWYSSTVEYLIGNFVRFNGIYFLNLNIPVLNASLLRSSNANDKNELKILATITESSGIRVVAHYENNVLHSRTTECPLDKSQSYIQGIVEQEITDCLIAARRIIQDTAAKPTLIILGSKEMQGLMQNSKFPNAEEVVIVPTTSFDTVSDQELSDKIILASLSKILTLPADNSVLHTLKRLVQYNSLVFKPISFVLVLFCILLGVNTFKTKRLLWDTTVINNEAYKVEEAYRDIKEKYPNIQNLDQIIDFHAATTELREAQRILPFEALDKILESLPRGFNVSKIYWGLESDKHSARYSLFKNHDVSHDSNQLQHEPNNNKYNVATRIEITAKYITNASSEALAVTQLDEDMVDFKKIMSTYEIKYSYDKSDIIHHGTKSTIPVELVIIRLNGM